MRPDLARFLLSVAYPTPGLVLRDMIDTVERILVNDPDKAARVAGQLAGNAMRINLREGCLVIR